MFSYVVLAFENKSLSSDDCIQRVAKFLALMKSVNGTRCFSWKDLGVIHYLSAKFVELEKMRDGTKDSTFNRDLDVLERLTLSVAADGTNVSALKDHAVVAARLGQYEVMRKDRAVLEAMKGNVSGTRLSARIANSVVL